MSDDNNAAPGPQDRRDIWRSAALSEREELLRESERIANMGSYVWDIQTNEVGWSEHLYRIFGHEPGAVEPTFELFMAAVHPDDREFVAGLAGKILAGEDSSGSSYRLLLPDGSIRYVTSNFMLVRDDEGRNVRLFGTLRDITETTQTEDALRRAALALEEAQRIAQVGSWRWDLASNEIEWSAETYRILGYDASVIPSNEAWFARVHPDDQETQREGHARAKTTGDTGTTEFRIVTPAGEVRHVQMAARQVRDEADRPPTIVGTVIDVTTRRGLEEQLRQSQKLEAVGRLAGGVAHDFNNLLTVIVANVAFLRMEGDREELRQMAKVAKDAASLVQQLLAFSRRAVLDPRIVDVKETIRGGLKLIERLLGEEIETVFEPASDTWRARVDHTQLQQILLNLAANARDAMPGGGSFTIRTRNVTLSEADTSGHPEATPGPHVLITVTDTGVGMEPETRAHIFEPFFTTKGAGHGTGLGLAMVFGAMAQNGGFVNVRSEVGKGSTFSLYFPRGDTQGSADGAEAKAEPTPSTILLVEDDDLVRSILSRILDRAGYRVLEANGGAKAESLWREHGQEVDLLVADVIMPDMSGRQLAAKLTSNAQGLRVLYISGYAPEEQEEEQLVPEGAYLQKPFEPEVLLRRVRELLGEDPPDNDPG